MMSHIGYLNTELPSLGAGIGGLTAALGLRRNGHKVTVSI